MKISTARIILLRFFTSIFLLFTIFFFFSPSHFSKPVLDKARTFFDRHNRVNNAIFSSSIDHRHTRKQLSSQATTPPVDKKDVDDVVVLTGKNFSGFVNGNPYVMLNFYAPWCYWSRKLAPEYAAAATMVKKSKRKAVLAKIDAVQEPELVRKFKISGYPTMYFLVGGVDKIIYEFTEQRTRDSIANWVYQKMNNDVQTLTTMEEAEHILAAKSVIVLGFLDNFEGQDSKELAAVSKLHIDVNFYQTSNVNVANLFHINNRSKRPALVVLKLNRDRSNHTHFVYENQFTRTAIADFVSIYKLPSVINLTLEDASNIFENPMKKLLLFTYHRSSHVVSIFEEAAIYFKGKLLFVHVDIATEDSVGRGLAYQFGISVKTAPRVVGHHMENGQSKKIIYNDEWTLNRIKSFAEWFLQAKFLKKSGMATETIIRRPLLSRISDSSSIPHAY